MIETFKLFDVFTNVVILLTPTPTDSSKGLGHRVDFLGKQISIMFIHQIPNCSYGNNIHIEVGHLKFPALFLRNKLHLFCLCNKIHCTLKYYQEIRWYRLDQSNCTFLRYHPVLLMLRQVNVFIYISSENAIVSCMLLVCVAGPPSPRVEQGDIINHSTAQISSTAPVHMLPGLLGQQNNVNIASHLQCNIGVLLNI